MLHLGKSLLLRLHRLYQDKHGFVFPVQKIFTRQMNNVTRTRPVSVHPQHESQIHVICSAMFNHFRRPVAVLAPAVVDVCCAPIFPGCSGVRGVACEDFVVAMVVLAADERPARSGVGVGGAQSPWLAVISNPAPSS